MDYSIKKEEKICYKKAYCNIRRRKFLMVLLFDENIMYKMWDCDVSGSDIFDRKLKF